MLVMAFALTAYQRTRDAHSPRGCHSQCNMVQFREEGPEWRVSTCCTEARPRCQPTMLLNMVRSCEISKLDGRTDGADEDYRLDGVSISWSVAFEVVKRKVRS